jgi:hypothetical protein
MPGTRIPLQRVATCVIIKFDLSPPETAYHVPAVIFCELFNVRFGHFSQNSQLHRLCHKVFGFDRERFGDLYGESWQVLGHRSPF